MTSHRTLMILLSLGLMTLLAAFGCDNTQPGDDDDVAGDDDDTADDDDTGDDDDDDTTAPAPEIASTIPQQGETAFCWVRNIEVTFTDVPDLTSFTMADGNGVPVNGDLDANDDDTVFTFDPDDDLEPDTDYVVTVEWVGHSVTILEFTTGPEDCPVTYPQDDVVGRDYLVDFASANFVEPPGVGALISQYLIDIQMVVHLREIDEGAATLGAYAGMLTEGVQDLCQQTTDLTAAAPGVWDNPHAVLGSGDIVVPVESELMSIYDLTLTGTFSCDGMTLQAGTLEGLMDTRAMDSLIDPNAQEGAACELLESLGIYCAPCPNNGGDFCLEAVAEDLQAHDTPVSGTDPETGASYDTLTEVTEAMLDAWTAGGDCP